jgi:hypothetical protein
MAKAKRAAKKKGGSIWFGIVVLIVGILYVLCDLGTFGTWNCFDIAGWSAFFVLAGVWMLFARK